MISIDRHCYELSYCIQSLISGCELLPEYHDSEWGRVYDWLYLASSVSVVYADPSRHDGYLYCEPVQELMNRESKAYSSFVKDLSVFNFVWSSFENISKALSKYTSSKVRKCQSNALKGIGFINKYSELVEGIPYYNECLNDLVFLLKEKSRYFLNDYSEYKGDISHFSMGIWYVKEIRNSFAHGSSGIPTVIDCDDGRKADEYSNVILLSTRLVLMTIQLMASSYLKIDDGCLFLWGVHNECSDDDHILNKLMKVHLSFNDPIQDVLFYERGD